MHTTSSTKQAPSPILVTLEEAARLLGCGKTTVYQYVRSGELHIVHHGKRSTLAVAELHDLAHRLASTAGVPDSLLVAAQQ
jgi:excisionase family DNA binding protein